MKHLLLFSAFALVSSSTYAATIFSDDFSGNGTDLNGSTPDITTGGATWIAASVFNRDGSIDPNPGSATLAFIPVNGFVYTLDTSLRGFSGNSNWFAMGFANGQNTGSTASQRFITGNVIGTAWMLFRGDASVNANQPWLGTGTGSNGGVVSTAAWAGSLTNANPGGDVDMRIVLDTTGGSGTWTSTWFAKRPSDSSYTEVRPETAMLTESMNSVGFALSNTGVDGEIVSFSLTSIPEPSTAALFVSAGLMLLRRRRHRTLD